MSKRSPFGKFSPGGMAKDDFEEFNLEEMEKESEEILRLFELTEKNAFFSKTEGGFVDLKVEDNYYPRVVFYRTFPFTDPNIFISVREADEKAKEIGMIRNLQKDFSKETIELLNEQMNMRYFMPKIKKIFNIKEEYGYAYFDVETDYGRCNFTTNSGGKSVITLSDIRIIITDLDGNRFELENLSKLSSKELKKLDVFL